MDRSYEHSLITAYHVFIERLKLIMIRAIVDERLCGSTHSWVFFSKDRHSKFKSPPESIAKCRFLYSRVNVHL